MPIINLQVSGNEDRTLANELAKSISTLTKEILNKKPEVTVVNVSFISEHLWFVHSQSLAALKQKSFHLTVKISDSTNLKDDKARFIQEVHTSIASILGDVHPVSYTAVEEMKADAYGYEGQTIEYKIISNKINNQS